MNSEYVEPTAPPSSPAPKQSRFWQRLFLIVVALVLIVYIILPPIHPLKKADLVGYSICHRIPERSLFILGRQLPLCARCTGTYIGVTVGFIMIALLKRWRAGEMLSTPYLILMGLFIAAFGVDGLNSYLTLWGSSVPTLYTPQNWLRMITGSLNGMALTMIVWPVFNITLWAETKAIRPLQKGWEVLAMLGLDAALIALALTQADWLLYPLALVSSLGVMWMLTLVNTMILLLLIRKDAMIQTWRGAAIALLGGLLITLLELTATGTMRFMLTGTMEWPL